MRLRVYARNEGFAALRESNKNWVLARNEEEESTIKG